MLLCTRCRGVGIQNSIANSVPRVMGVCGNEERGDFWDFDRTGRLKDKRVDFVDREWKGPF